MRTQKGGDWPTFMIFKMKYFVGFHIWYSMPIWDVLYMIHVAQLQIFYIYLCINNLVFFDMFLGFILNDIFTFCNIVFFEIRYEACVIFETYFISKCSNFPCHEVFFQFIFEKKILSYRLLLGVIWYDTLLETKISPTSGHFWVDWLSFSHVIVSWRYHITWYDHLLLPRNSTSHRIHVWYIYLHLP